MEVTLKPQFLSRTPTLLAVTPFPSPLTTPPEIRMYFILAVPHCQTGMQQPLAEPSWLCWVTAEHPARGGCYQGCAS